MIPKTFNFIYLYDEKNVMSLNINHYICVKSHLLNNVGSKAKIITNNPEKFYEFPWMSKLVCDCVGRIEIEYHERLTNWNGMSIVSPMQESDILRFETLMYQGGVYCDLDMLSVKALPASYWESETSIQGIEPYSKFLSPRALGSAFIMVPYKEGVVNKWMELILNPYRFYDSEIKKGLYELPIFRPYRLSKLYPELVTVKDWFEFFPMYFYYEDVANFFLHEDYKEFSQMTYEVHLWENKTKGLIKYFDEQYFKEGKTYYAKLGCKVLEEELK